MSEVVDLALEMINIESTSGAEMPMADFLQSWLEPRGWTVVRQKYSEGRDNVYAHRPQQTPRMIFNSHIDTVPPYFPASIDETWIHGRGACDTKSLIAAQLLAAQSMVEAGIEDYWYKYVGIDGRVVGMTSFGESAPAGGRARRRRRGPTRAPVRRR